MSRSLIVVVAVLAGLVVAPASWANLGLPSCSSDRGTVAAASAQVSVLSVAYENERAVYGCRRGKAKPLRLWDCIADVCGVDAVANGCWAVALDTRSNRYVSDDSPSRLFRVNMCGRTKSRIASSWISESGTQGRRPVNDFVVTSSGAVVWVEFGSATDTTPAGPVLRKLDESGRGVLAAVPTLRLHSLALAEFDEARVYWTDDDGDHSRVLSTRR